MEKLFGGSISLQMKDVCITRTWSWHVGMMYSGIPIFLTLIISLEPPNNPRQKLFPSPQPNTVILPSISQTIAFFEPIAWRFKEWGFHCNFYSPALQCTRFQYNSCSSWGNSGSCNMQDNIIIYSAPGCSWSTVIYNSCQSARQNILLQVTGS